jgi:hypothetical protein
MEYTMRITARGWARDMGEKELMQYSLISAKFGNGTIYRDQPPEIFNSARGVKVAWHQGNLRLMGDYRIDVEFSKWDVLKLFKSIFGNELKASLLERHGFTVSEDLKKAVLRSVKLSDVTLGDLAAMNSTENHDNPATAEKLIEAENVRLLARRI